MAALLLVTASVGASTCSAQWTLQDSGTTASLRGIHSLGNGIAWASGSGGTVLRTTDGGAHWQHCTVPDAEKDGSTLDFRGVQAFDAETAIVLSSGKGNLSRLYKTVDRCATWTMVLTNPDADGFWDALRFSSVRSTGALLNTGVVLGDPVNGEFVIFATLDRGNTWTRQTAHKHDSTHDCGRKTFIALPNESVFAASNESLSLNGPSFLPSFFVTGGPISRFAFNVYLQELDGIVCSVTTRFIRLPLGGSASSGAFAAAVKMVKGQPVMQMMVVGGDYKQPDASAGTAVFVSPQPPLYLPYFGTLRKPATAPHGYRSAVAYDEKPKAWITVGPNGTDISTDDGRNWRALRPGAQDSPDADKNWNALSLPFVVGSGGRIGVLREGVLSKSKDAQK